MLEDGMLAFALLGAEWVLWLLILMSVGVFAVTLERLLLLQRDKGDPAAILDTLRGLEASGDVAACKASLDSLPGAEARILSAGLEVAPRGRHAVEAALAAAAGTEKLRMEQRLAYLATVGSNAPFIGLFGTVLGIIKAFKDLSEAAEGSNDAVIAGISEALVATAIGLLVAIPAVILYNWLSRTVKGRLALAQSLANDMVAPARARPGGLTWAPASPTTTMSSATSTSRRSSTSSSSS